MKYALHLKGLKVKSLKSVFKTFLSALAFGHAIVILKLRHMGVGGLSKVAENMNIGSINCKWSYVKC